MLKLLVTKGSALGAEIQVDDELEIGRVAEGVGRLAGDVEISRRHARIARDADGAFLIEDLGSTNGTLVNGQLIEAPHALATGETIEVGGTTLFVEQAATGQHATAVPAEAASAEVAPEAPPEAPPEDPAATAPDQLAEPVPAETAAAPVRISLEIEVDVDEGRATIRLDDGPASAVELEHVDGVWRIRSE